MLDTATIASTIESLLSEAASYEAEANTLAKKGWRDNALHLLKQASACYDKVWEVAISHVNGWSSRSWASTGYYSGWAKGEVLCRPWADSEFQPAGPEVSREMIGSSTMVCRSDWERKCADWADTAYRAGQCLAQWEAQLDQKTPPPWKLHAQRRKRGAIRA